MAKPTFFCSRRPSEFGQRKGAIAISLSFFVNKMSTIGDFLRGKERLYVEPPSIPPLTAYERKKHNIHPLVIGEILRVEHKPGKISTTYGYTHLVYFDGTSNIKMEFFPPMGMEMSALFFAPEEQEEVNALSTYHKGLLDPQKEMVYMRWEVFVDLRYATWNWEAKEGCYVCDTRIRGFVFRDPESKHSIRLHFREDNSVGVVSSLPRQETMSVLRSPMCSGFMITSSKCKQDFIDDCGTKMIVLQSDRCDCECMNGALDLDLCQRCPYNPDCCTQLQEGPESPNCQRKTDLIPFCIL